MPLSESLATADAIRVLPEPRPGTHIGALDGVRGIAILLVLVFHFGSWAQMQGFSNLLLSAAQFGWCGVDLFFVLSGFLITGILYDSRDKENYFRNFFAKRILRIFPLYYLVFLLFATVSAFWWLLYNGTHSSLWVGFFLTNFSVAFWGWEAVPPTLEHFWSLAIEEQFYLLWPLAVRKGTRSQLLILTAALIVIAFVIRAALVATGTDPVAVFTLTPTRFDALAFGAFCSLAVRGPHGAADLLRPGAIAMLVSGATLLFIISATGTVSDYNATMQAFGFSFLGAAFGGTILVGIIWRPLNIILSNTVLRWFGRYSFGLYVWHYPVGVLLLEQPATRTALGIAEASIGSIVLIMFALGLTILTALFSFHYWEKPFLQLKTRFA